MSIELKKRIITSILLLILLVLMSFYTYILIVSLIIIGIIAWIESYALISKIYKKSNYNNIALRFILKATSLLYLSYLVFIIILSKLDLPEFYILIIYAILISVMTDIGGLTVGKIFKGRKLTKISPNKTISGSFGSLFFSLILLTIYILISSSINFFFLLLLTLAISVISQIGDLLISYIKRKAKVKDTSNILPGHGGLLDRLDGILFALPIGVLIIIYI